MAKKNLSLWLFVVQGPFFDTLLHDQVLLTRKCSDQISIFSRWASFFLLSSKPSKTKNLNRVIRADCNLSSGLLIRFYFGKEKKRSSNSLSSTTLYVYNLSYKSSSSITGDRFVFSLVPKYNRFHTHIFIFYSIQYM